ncbi:Aste57867_23283 [Aphanomyces stellatus]|uniref:Aste57867_23283 protein n=1 Tax=Aphanomyces stellatus TaxID=120398 RepID=A0A485LNZ5_9STRA|nr:hypothetical protein As57867_023212 [Aphanomyces stellatus]VFT99928.1 Aste57867_23283 [Aphanomyces stellatus]
MFLTFESAGSSVAPASLRVAPPSSSCIMGFKINNVTWIFVLLCCINMLNYIDRGIIPGAPIEFQAFIQQYHGVDRSGVSVYIGILVSAFIASYSIFICIFGYMSMTRRPFLLSAIGLFIWVLAIVLCGLAKPLKSFYALLIGRLLSGIGESSFHATTPPFIDEFAPAKSRTLWLGIFYCGISVGTAVGYTYGAAMAKIWDYGFYATAILMAPMAYACWQWIPAHFDYPLAHGGVKELEGIEARNSLMGPGSINQAEVQAEVAKEVAETKESIPTIVWSLLKDPIFLFSTLGVAAYSFTIAGMGAFAPAILIGYGLLSESTASMGFGAIAVLAGLIGSPLGGWLIDRQCRGREADEVYRLYVSARQMIVFMSIGVAFALVSVAFMDNKIIFLLFLWIALTFIFMTQSAQTLVILYSTPKAKRGFAVGLNTLLLHAVGDVPSPVILGALKDFWAPHCGSVWNDKNEQKIDPECSKDKDGLKKVLLFAYGWLLWSVLCWAVTFAVARYRLNKAQKEESSLVETPVRTDE